MTLAPAVARAAGARPGWSGYIAVDDVDAVVGEIVRRGGAVHREAADVPEIGRSAVVADPQGAVFVVSNTMAASSPAPAPEIGDCAWHELIADDSDAAFAFYADLFGWTKAHAVEMESVGLYQLFAKDGVSIGGMMARSPQMPGAHWRYYFRVDGIDAAAARIVAAGGTVQDGPHEVPGDDWIVQGCDPQGVTFSLVSKIR